MPRRPSHPFVRMTTVRVPRWIRYGTRPGVRYRYGQTDYWVVHCGHPTALWPYYGQAPDGQMILTPTGRGFQYLKDAKAAVEAVYRKENRS